jgi:MFS family permease
LTSPGGMPRNFTLIWLSRTVTYFGDTGMLLTISFAVLTIGQPQQVGYCLGALIAAKLAAAAIAGGIADRWGRRRTLVLGDLLLALLQTATGLVVLSGRATFEMILCVTIAYGVLSALASPALIGLLPEEVPDALLSRANARLSASNSAMRLIGPATAGLIAAAASPGWFYLVDAASSAAAIVPLLAVKRAAQRPVSRPSNEMSILRATPIAIREVRRHRWYLPSVAGHATANLGITACIVLGPHVAETSLGGAGSWGLIVAAGGGGALIGGLLLASLVGPRPLLVANVAGGLAALQTLSLIRPEPLIVVALFSAIGSIAVVRVNQVWNSVLQLRVARDVISSVSALDDIVAFCTLPLGMFLSGLAAASLGDAWVLAIGGILGLLGPMISLFSPSVWDIDLPRKHAPSASGAMIFETASLPSDKSEITIEGPGT